MARPIIDRLFDHTVRIWRPTASSDNRLGVERREYVVVASDVGCALNRSTAPVQDTGPGMQPIGARRFYFRPDLDIRIRDVIEITTGPDAVQTWEVDQPPTRPRGHHTQIDAIVWLGDLGPLNEATVIIAALGAVVRMTGTVSNPELPDPKFTALHMRPGTEIRATGIVRNFQAIGGVITEAGGYRIHTFLASGNFEVLGGHHDNVEYLVVAGGGAGGGGFNGYPSGGGGGGGVRTAVAQPFVVGVYPVVVGAGGVNTGQSLGPSGSNSSFNGLVSTGGGGGGAGGIAGAAGGSGGGGNGGSPSSNGGAGTVGQGNNGGNGFTNSYAGGGGGAGAVGSNGNTATTNSDGGVGVASSISGAAVIYGGGGGGANNSNDTNSGLGGDGGGGKWHVQAANGAVVNPATSTANGTPNTGGGGGGRTTPNSGINRGGSGGSGIVIIRYSI